MRSHRPQRNAGVIVGLGLCLVTVACGSDMKPSSADSLKAISVPVPGNPPLTVNTGWDESVAGQFMILSAADDGITAALVMPNETDSSMAQKKMFQIDALANTPVDLFNAAGAAGSSSIAINSQQLPSEGCLVWPAARLITKPSNAWSIGFPAGHAKSIQIDSVEKLPESDSVSITTELVKQASALSMNGDPAFRGLPFIVRKAYRLSMADTTALLGSIVRKINEEANPREEHLLLVVERNGRADSPYTVAYQNRTAGAEADVRTNAILAAVRFVKTNTPAIVLSFEYDDGGQIALLERVASHTWKITWRSAYTGC
jgi:hypothetical protein